MRFKSNASTRACVRSDDRNTKQNAVIAMAQATLEGFAVQENPTRKELGTCPTTVPSVLSKATAFRSWGFPASCRTCTISSVLGVHNMVKKNIVVWHWGACHLLRSCRLFNVYARSITRLAITSFLMLGVATIIPLVKRTLSVRRIVSYSLSL